jgi:hypothetical protein
VFNLLVETIHLFTSFSALLHIPASRSQWGIFPVVVNHAVSSSYLQDSSNCLPSVTVPGRRSQSYEPLLLENEREAVADLLQYLESEYFFEP